MIKITIIIIVLFLTTILHAQDPSAIVEYESTEKGILIPRMSTTDRVAINLPANSLLVYDTTSASFWYWKDTAWIEIASSDVNTDDQNLSLTGAMLSIEDGTGVDLSGINTDTQTLSLNGDTLGISNGNSVMLSALFSLDGDAITDADNDTKIQVEESADEDKIRFDLAGTEHFVMEGYRLKVLNSGNMVLIGAGAGENDDPSQNRETTAIGDSALHNNGVGASISFQAIGNTAIGSKALFANTTGSYSTANGYNALYSNTTGSYNTANGTWALYSNTTDSPTPQMGIVLYTPIQRDFPISQMVIVLYTPIRPGTGM